MGLGLACGGGAGAIGAGWTVIETGNEDSMATDAAIRVPPEKLDWSPYSIGISGKSHRLVRRAQSIELCPTIRAWVGTGLFLSIGPLCSGLLLVKLPWPVMLFVAFGWFVTIAVAMTARQALARVTFDAQTQRVWRDPPGHPRRRSAFWVASATFEQALAFQLLAGPKDSEGWLIYELNLVLRDGSRVHIAALDDFDTLESEAGALSGLLSVPVWRQPGFR